MFKLISCFVVLASMFSNFANADQSITREMQEKFFLTNTNIKTMQELGYKVNDFVVDYMSTIDTKKVYSGKSYKEINEMFKPYSVLGNSLSLSSIFEQINAIADNSMRLNSKYIGHMLTIPTFLSVLINPVIDAMNFDMSSDNVPNFIQEIENQTINWLAEIMGYEIPKVESIENPMPGGIITNGGTIANLMAFLIFRNKYLASIGIDLTKDGLLSLPNKKELIVFVSKEAHYSLKKIGGYIGLGSDNIVEVDVDDNFRMDINDLKNKVKQAKQEEKTILGIIANAGSTGTGSIDPLEEIAALAKENNIWFHADAAYGGACTLTQKHLELKKAIHAIKLADSITIDPHKLFYIPYNLGSLLVKDRNNLRYIKGIENSEIIKLSSKTMQSPKRFDALKLWVALKFMGTHNLSSLIDYTIDMTFYMHELFKNAEDFENLSNPQMNLFVFRYIPKYLKTRLDHAIVTKNHQQIREINKQLNKLTVKLQTELQKNGLTWFSYTSVLEGSKYNKHTNLETESRNHLTGFRLVLMNPFVNPQTLDESFLIIRQTAEKVADVQKKVTEFPKRLSVSEKVFKEVDSFRKYFANQSNNTEEIRKIGKNIIDIITCNKADNKNIDLGLYDSFPRESSSSEFVLSTVQKIYNDFLKFNNGKFANVPFISILSSSISAAFNQNQIAFEVSPASSVIENKLVRDLTKLVGYKPIMVHEDDLNISIKPGGIITNGSSFSLLTMLLVARNKLFQQKLEIGKDITKTGLRVIDPNDDLIFITSKSQESIMKELANMLGLGPQKVITVDEVNGNTDIDALTEQILISKKLNQTIMAIDIFVSNTKALDLIKLNQLCKLKDIFINVTLSGNLKQILNKEEILCAELADSIVLDLPNCFNMPFGIGVVLFQDRDILKSYLKLSAPYLFRKKEDFIMCNIGSYSIEGSKGFQALKLWTALQHMGIDTYKQLGDTPIV